jgi:uncharacterized membrane protein YjgN (DUF898 family)
MQSLATVPTTTSIAYTGETRALSAIVWRNFALTLLTLGLWALWGRVHKRRYVWGQVCIGGAPLLWAGGVGEQLGTRDAASRGIAAAFALSLLLALAQWLTPGSEAAVLRTALSIAAFPAYRLLRYRYLMHRTLWRGVAFAHTGEVRAYTRLFLAEAAKVVLTLGLHYPRFAVATQRYLVEHSHWGAHRFRYTGEAQALRRAYLFGALFSLLSLGAYLPWHLARLRNYHTSHTHIGRLGCASWQQGNSLSNLWGLNLLIIIGTLGLGIGWAQTRALRYRAEHMTLLGDVDALPALPGPHAEACGLGELLSFGSDIVFGA